MAKDEIKEFGGFEAAPPKLQIERHPYDPRPIHDDHINLSYPELDTALTAAVARIVELEQTKSEYEKFKAFHEQEQTIWDKHRNEFFSLISEKDGLLKAANAEISSLSSEKDELNHISQQTQNALMVDRGKLQMLEQLGIIPPLGEKYIEPLSTPWANDGRRMSRG